MLNLGFGVAQCAGGVQNCANAMNREVIGWIVAAAIVAAWWFEPNAVRRKYDFHNAPGIVFVVENESGKIWRYYRNTTNGVPTSEGFCLLSMQTDGQSSASELLKDVVGSTK